MKRKSNNILIAPVNGEAESQELDQLLWETLWMPLDLPRNIRESFTLGGKVIELGAKADGKLIGGLVANWTSNKEIEIRHIAITPEFQNQGIGSNLVEFLISTVSEQGCMRIHTIARNNSVEFFRKLGFVVSPEIFPAHPDFEKQGISFVSMWRNME